MKSLIVVRTVIVNEKGEALLLTRSADDTRRPGEPDFPGGGVEIGEDVLLAAAREDEEETGISLKPEELLLLFAATETKGDRSTTRILYGAKVGMPNVVTSPEHTGYQWVPLAEVSTHWRHHFWGMAVDHALEHGLLDSTQVTE